MSAVARRAAAVTIAIGALPPHGVLFVERAAHLRDHPGQIGLPGGGVDPADGGDLLRTALRELREELGVVPERIRFVGRLPTLHQRRNTFDVTPFVAVVAPGPYTIDGDETAGMFAIPLLRIVEGGLRDGIVAYRGMQIDTLVLDFEGRRVWGLTARILRSFLDAWEDDGTGLRASVEAALAAATLAQPAEGSS